MHHITINLQDVRRPLPSDCVPFCASEDDSDASKGPMERCKHRPHCLAALEEDACAWHALSQRI